MRSEISSCDSPKGQRLLDPVAGVAKDAVGLGQVTDNDSRIVMKHGRHLSQIESCYESRLLRLVVRANPDE